MIPNNWQEKKVADLIKNLEAGASVNGEDRLKRLGEVGVLKISAVTYGSFNPDAYKVVTSETERQRLFVNPTRDSIIISRANTLELVGASSYIDADYPEIFLPDKLWKLTTRDRYNAVWLSQVLATKAVRSLISNRATGTSGSMKNISQEAFLTIPILVPPLAEQRKIAAILGTWDAAIATAERLVAALQRRKQALMQRLLTGAVRFPGFAGEWEQVKLGQVFFERRESGRVDLPLLSITNSQGVVPRDMVERRDTSAEDKGKYLRICKGDLGYNTMRMWQGVSAVSKFEGIVSPAYTICKPEEQIDVDFIGYLFKYDPMIHLFWRYSQGLVDDTLSLKFNVFAKIPISLPALAEQKRIAVLLKTCDREILQQKQQSALLNQQKRGLMQRLLTGEVRVAGDDERS